VTGETSPLEFPCEIPIKVFGRNEERFRSAVLDIVRRHFEGLDDTSVVERSSRADNYLSMTVTVHAKTRAQVDACYRELTAHDQIMMVL
jgi:putative lipoic acid-binding regulatory protein